MEENTTIESVENNVIADAPKEEKEFSLLERLEKATEKKTEPTGIVKKEENSFFGSDSDFEPTEKKSIDNPLLKTEENKEVAKVVTKDAKWASARTAVGMMDMTFQGIFTPLQNRKFKRKFTAEQIKRIEGGLDDATIELIEDEEDKRLKKKWDKLLKKHLKKVDAIPLQEKEKADLEQAFYQYFDFKQKTLPPEWFIGMAIINSLGSRTIDLVMD